MINIDFTTKHKEITPEYIVKKDGYKCLYNEMGKLHSYNDMPAVIYPDGTKLWCKHGKLHRGNGLPAMISSTGTNYWENGKRIK